MRSSVVAIATLPASMHSEHARRWQLHARKLCARRKQRDELRDRRPPRALGKKDLDPRPDSREWQQVSGNRAGQMYDVEAVSRLDRWADLADLQSENRTLELRGRHARRELPETAARRSRGAVRMSGGHLPKCSRVVAQASTNGFGALARRLEGTGLIARSRNQNMRALEDVRRAETHCV